jgi:nucleolar complex protein 3
VLGSHAQQTETLKNLFVLYFSILKSPVPSPMLPAALEGISHFAHFINVDFFRDLLAVLRMIIQESGGGDATTNNTGGTAGDDEEEDSSLAYGPADTSHQTRTRILAIVTAFDLLSGQGEALNIDLGDFINALFAILRPLAIDTGLEDTPHTSLSGAAALPTTASRYVPQTPRERELYPKRGAPTSTGGGRGKSVHLSSTSDLLFRSLNSVFFSRHASHPSARKLAFAKRLLESSLHLPPRSARQALEFVRALMAKDAKLACLLDTEERMYDGIYTPEMDDPALCNAGATVAWEVTPLGRHVAKDVRSATAKVGEVV